MRSGTLRRAALAGGAAAMIAALAFLFTLQVGPNSSPDPYATDIGEIQNALPRWGTLHFTGYPVYSVTGSAAVTALRLVGVSPATGASLVSAIWGSLGVGLTAALAVAVGAGAWAAAAGAVAFGLSTSMWIDSSVAEVHTLTVAFTAAILLSAEAVRRRPSRLTAVVFALLFAQGVLHMRTVALLAPAAAVLMGRESRSLARHWRPVLATLLLSPLVYLYMPLREWTGATWTFGQTGTWDGFWAMLLDTKAERIVQPIGSLADLLERGRVILGLLHDDMPLPLLAVGLVGLVRARARHTAALTLAWLPYVALALVIWEGRVSDALLAVKLPAVQMAGIGLALLASGTWRRSGASAGWRARNGSLPLGAWLGVGLLVVACAGLAVRNTPKVTEVSRDRRLEPLVARIDADLQQLTEASSATGPPPPQGSPASESAGPLTLMAPWGHTYWILAYHQAYQGGLEGVAVRDHNQDFAAVLDAGGRLVTPPDTLYVFPTDWWADRLGSVALEMASPELLEIRREPRQVPHSAGSGSEPAPERGQTVNNSLAIDNAVAEWDPATGVSVVFDWRVLNAPDRDYSVAVHLVEAQGEPPAVLAQADSSHPVAGWSPTGRWTAGTVVRDAYRIEPPDGVTPRRLRVTVYYQNPDGTFVNGEWVEIPVVPRRRG